MNARPIRLRNALLPKEGRIIELDWVETRLVRDRVISEAGSDLWADLCSALEESVISLQRCYPNAATKAAFSKISGNKVAISVRRYKATRKVVATFRQDRAEIAVSVDYVKAEHRISLDVEHGNVVLKLEGARMAIDEIAK